MVAQILLNIAVVLGLLVAVLVFAAWRRRRLIAAGRPVPRTFRAGLPDWNLTAERWIQEDAARFRGTRTTWLDRTTLTTRGGSDPVHRLRAAATAGSKEVELRVTAAEIRWTDPEGGRFWPRDALLETFCSSGWRGRKSPGFAANLIYVRLRLRQPEDGEIEDVAVGISTFSQGVHRWVGARNAHPHSRAFAEAEALARELAEPTARTSTPAPSAPSPSGRGEPSPTSLRPACGPGGERRGSRSRNGRSGSVRRALCMCARAHPEGAASHANRASPRPLRRVCSRSSLVPFQRCLHHLDLRIRRSSCSQRSCRASSRSLSSFFPA